MNRRIVAFLVHFCTFLGAGYLHAAAPDQVPIPQDTLKKAANDSVRAIQLAEMKKNADFKSEITYKASKYMLLDVEGKVLYLSDGGQLKYETMVLNADSVVVDWDKNTVAAGGKMDSAGQYRGRPIFEENGQKYNAQAMSYNFKTQRGLVEGAKTKQGEEYVLAEKVKKVDENTYYILNGKFTSCELDHPHYYIKSKRLKVIPRDKIVTGPVQLVIEDFPMPLVLPFGFFPNQTGRRSGIVMPTYGESGDRGFFLRNLGYYFAISDRLDLLLSGDVFSKGGFRIAAETQYNRRYHYQGKFGVEYGYQKYGQPEDGPSLFREERNFWVKWDHNQKINPQAIFTASVDAGSSGFLRNNSYNEQDYLSNTLRSSINYNHAFANSSWRLNATLDHTMNTRNRQMVMGLPTLSVTKGRFFPFKGKTGGDKWYGKIGASYTMNLRNQISAPDSVIPQLLLSPLDDVTLISIREATESRPADTTITTQRGLDFYKNGVSHLVPVSTQFSIAKYFNVTPSLNLRERWYIKERLKTWNADSAEVVSTDRYGFYTSRDFDFRFNMSTRVVGIFNLKGSRNTMLRHTITPAIAYNYKPDYSRPGWKYFRTVQTDTAGTMQTYSRFEGSLFGGPEEGEDQRLDFSLNNVLDLKFRSKEALKDTTIKDPWTRVTLLDQFSINTSYNFAAESLKLAPIALNARTNLLNNKLNLLWNGSVDPYAVNAQGERIDTFRYKLNGTIGRLSTMSLTLGTRFQSKENKGASPEDEEEALQKRDNYNHLQYFRDLYVDFDVPWSLNINSVLSYSNTGLRKDTTLQLNFNGDFNLSPKWKLGFTSGYDFNLMDFSYTSVTIYRDLHCWEMSLNWVPFGQRKSFNFSLNVKSSTLKDLKLTKRRDWQDNF